MNRNQLAEELRIVIDTAIEEMPKASAADLANWMEDRHADLVEKFAKEWVHEKLESLFHIAMRAHNPMDRKGRPKFGHPKQERLALSEQFEKIPYWLQLEPHKRGGQRNREIRLPNATLKDLKQRRALIRGEMSVELPQLNRLIELMERYEKTQPGITVGQALRLRATAKREREA